MKYWLFDGSEILGPFTPQELAGRSGFSSTSLVCPDGFSDQADQWQLAGSYAELQDALNGNSNSSEPQQEPLTDNPVDVEEMPTSGDSSLHIPQTPSKAGPIEEYFNTIKGEDLGNILGIPDPNESTDADLARVIERELGSMPETEVYESLRVPVPDSNDQPQGTTPVQAVTEKEPLKETAEKSVPTETAAVQTTPQEQSAPQTQPVPTEQPAPEKTPAQDALEAAQNAHAQDVPQEEKTQQTPETKPAENIRLSNVKPDEKIILTPAQHPMSSGNKPDEKKILTPAQHAVSSGNKQAVKKTNTPQKKAVSANAKPDKKESAPVKKAPQNTQAPSAKTPASAEKTDSRATLTREPDSPEGIRIIDLDDKKPSSKEPVNKKKTGPVKKKKPAVVVASLPAEKIVKNEVEIEQFDTGTPQEETTDYQELAQQLPQNQPAPQEEVHKRSRRRLWIVAAAALLILFVLVRVSLQKENDFTHLTDSVKTTLSGIFPAWKNGTTATPEETVDPQQRPVRSVATALADPSKSVLNEETDLRSPYAEPEAEDWSDLSLTEGTALTPAQTALLTVQQYELSGGRGKIKDYLQNYYAAQFAKGYEADWSVAPLHKNIYIVQYRLTKTRTEPIVYVFQADGEKGILTDALNNITLDLVGKIEQ